MLLHLQYNTQIVYIYIYIYYMYQLYLYIYIHIDSYQNSQRWSLRIKLYNTFYAISYYTYIYIYQYNDV